MAYLNDLTGDVAETTAYLVDAGGDDAHSLIAIDEKNPPFAVLRLTPRAMSSQPTPVLGTTAAGAGYPGQGGPG